MRLYVALIWAVATAVSGAFSITSAAAEKRIALVIGNSSYRHLPKLASPANDARLMAEALKQIGFEVRLVLDAEEAVLREEVSRFSDALDEQGDIGLFYYSGHAIQIAGRNHLLPTSAQIERGRKASIASFGLDEVLSALGRKDRRATKIVVLEASRKNTIAAGFRLVSPGLAKIDPPSGTVIASSAGPGKVTASGQVSGFTCALAGALTTPGLSVEQALNEAKREVIAMTRGQQRPWIATKARPATQEAKTSAANGGPDAASLARGFRALFQRADAGCV